MLNILWNHFMTIITSDTLNNLTSKAVTSARKRTNLCLHTNADDICQRMINALEPETYVQPHKHENPDKDELFIVLRGSAVMIEFDNTGTVTGHAFLDAGKGVFAVEIPPRVFHTLICLEKGTVCVEIKQGPYTADDKNFASWAPKEGEPGAAEYNEGLLKKILSQI
jgi:cupin fold WbuC family metalloprotein